MKKTYVNPTMKVDNYEVEELLAGSLDVQEQTGGTLNSREGRFSGWDEEE